MALRPTSCCGLREYSGLGKTPEASLYSLAKNYHQYLPVPFIIFTDAVKNGRGRALKQFIIDNSMGSVMVTEPKFNPNSRNELEVFIYNPDAKALAAWFKKSTPVYEKEVEMMAAWMSNAATARLIWNGYGWLNSIQKPNTVFYQN